MATSPSLAEASAALALWSPRALCEETRIFENRPITQKPASRMVRPRAHFRLVRALAADEPLLHTDKPLASTARVSAEGHPQNPSCQSRAFGNATVSRLGFLGRVHRKSDSGTTHKPLASCCQEKNENLRQIFLASALATTGSLFFCFKQHVSRCYTLSPAVLRVERQIVLGQIVFRGEP